LGCDVRLFNPPVAALPRAMVVSNRSRTDGWLGQLTRLAVAEAFMHFVGQPPMHYLAQWRMQLAAGLLSSSGASIRAIASDLGYRSEAAFQPRLQEAGRHAARDLAPAAAHERVGRKQRCMLHGSKSAGDYASLVRSMRSR